MSRSFCCSSGTEPSQTWSRSSTTPKQLVLRVVTAVRGSCELVLPDGRGLSVTPPFPRLTVTEAFRQYANVANAGELAEQDEGQFFQTARGASGTGAGGLFAASPVVAVIQ